MFMSHGFEPKLISQSLFLDMCIQKYIIVHLGMTLFGFELMLYQYNGFISGCNDE